jgi:hypothetical protein
MQTVNHRRLDVRSGSGADISRSGFYVRFTPNNGHQISICPFLKDEQPHEADDMSVFEGRTAARSRKLSQ